MYHRITKTSEKIKDVSFHHYLTKTSEKGCRYSLPPISRRRVRMVADAKIIFEGVLEVRQKN